MFTRSYARLHHTVHSVLATACHLCSGMSVAPTQREVSPCSTGVVARAPLFSSWGCASQLFPACESIPHFCCFLQSEAVSCQVIRVYWLNAQSSLRSNANWRLQCQPPRHFFFIPFLPAENPTSMEEILSKDNSEISAGDINSFAAAYPATGSSISQQCLVLSRAHSNSLQHSLVWTMKTSARQCKS